MVWCDSLASLENDAMAAVLKLSRPWSRFWEISVHLIDCARKWLCVLCSKSGVKCLDGLTAEVSAQAMSSLMLPSQPYEIRTNSSPTLPHERLRHALEPV